MEIVLVENYPHPVEKVWAALIDPVALAEWLMVNDFEPRVGKRFTFRAEPRPDWRGRIECIVLEMEPPRRMVWSWLHDETGDPTRVEFHLEAFEGGTRLTLKHTGETDPTTRERLSSGWPVKLRDLTSLLAKAA